MAKLYVAYGSNLNKEQMRYRCPTAKFVGTGIIEGYELQFKGALHGACATIAPKEGAAVPVGIWTIQKPDEKRLDLYEGSVIGGKAPALLKKLSLRDLRNEHVGRRKSLCATAKQIVHAYMKQTGNCDYHIVRRHTSS